MRNENMVPMKAVLGFNPESHTYYNAETGEKIISVTQLLKKHGLAPDYGNVDPEVLQRKADIGNLIHREIEDFVKHGKHGITLEEGHFERFVSMRGLKHMASEERVCNDIVAGTLDLTATDSEGKRLIIDIKTTYDKHPYQWAWQVSLYEYLSGEKFDELLVLWLHEDDDGVHCDVLPLDRINEKSIEDLLECERQGIVYQTAISILPESELTKLVDLEALIVETEARLDEAKKAEGKIRAAALEAMKKHNLKTFETTKLKFTYVAPSTRKTVDTTKLKGEMPSVYEKYLKETAVKESLRVAVK